MSKYAVGDRVYLEAEIRQVDIEPYGVPYNVKFLNGATMWTDESNIFSISKTYEDGLNDAWELAKKICGYNKDVFDGITLSKIFGTASIGHIMDEYTYQQALAKIEAYEKSQQIQVGDVVYEFDKEEYGYGVVTDLCDDECCILWDEGYCNKMEIENLVKTGRHIDISSILKQIRWE